MKSFHDGLLWEASGDIEKQQRMANGPANRGSLFNVRRSVLHSLPRFLFICSNVLYSRFAIQCLPRRSPFAAPFAIRLVIRRAVRHSTRRSLFAIRLIIRCAVRHSPRRFLFIFPNFRNSNFAIQCSAILKFKYNASRAGYLWAGNTYDAHASNKSTQFGAVQ